MTSVVTGRTRSHGRATTPTWSAALSAFHKRSNGLSFATLTDLGFHVPAIDASAQVLRSSNARRVKGETK